MTEEIITIGHVGYTSKVVVEVVSMRDQFAMAALTAIPACGNTAKEVSEWAYEIADAMLEARKEKK